MDILSNLKKLNVFFLDQLKFIKSKYRSELTDENLSKLVQTALTNYQPDFKSLTANMNTRKSTFQK